MSRTKPLSIVLDTSVLINFLRIDRMDLLTRYSHEFIITDHVADEITNHYTNHYSDQQERFTTARENGTLQPISITDPVEVESFGKLISSDRLGAGECSAIALVIHRGHILAIDDRYASEQALHASQSIQIQTTQDLMVSMIHENLLNVQQADTIKDTWAKDHRFRLRIKSFAELIR